MADSGAFSDLEGIPDEAREIWQKLLAEQLVPVADLRAEVRDYQKAISAKARWSDDVDPSLAGRLAEASLKLLHTIDDKSPEEQRRLVQAAVRYFVLQEDAESDLDSVLGLDDDVEVLNAVLKHLGRDDWLIRIH